MVIVVLGTASVWFITSQPLPPQFTAEESASQPPPAASSALGRSSRDIFTAIYAKRTGVASAGPAWDAPFAKQAAPFDELDVQELLLELEHTLGREISEADLRSQAGLANMDELASHLTPAQVIALMDQARPVNPAASGAARALAEKQD